MAKHKEQTNQIDDFLLRIETRERTRRRNRLLLLLGAIVLIGGGWQLLRTQDRQAPLRSFELTSLTQAQVLQLLAEKPEPIVVFHPGLGTDTISSADELLNLQNMVEMMDFPSMFASDQSMADGLIQDSTSEIGGFFLDVAGVREAGQVLQLTIENYDEENTYMMDFGNGYRRRVRRNFTYTYPRQGNFQARLIATNGEANGVYIKNLRISPGSTVIAADESATPAETPVELADVSASLDSGNQVASLRVGSLPELEIVDLQAPEEALGESPLSGGAEPVNTNFASVSTEPDNIPVAEEPEVAVRSAPAMTPMLTADIMPAYPGGTRGIGRYFRRNYRYPYEARNAQIEGVVYVRFVVQPSGELTDFVVVTGVGYGCDEEALRLLQNMPKWVPGEHQGKKVPVYKTLPVTFRLVE